MLRKTDPSIIKSYLEDSSNLTGGYSEGVYLPETEKEISEILSECNAKKIPVTVFGGGTGTTGGCIPFEGWTLSTEKLNKILEINSQEQFAIVQPGVTLEELEAALKKESLLYPPDPTEKTATLGGNVSTNASGGRSYRFGSTRDYVRRLRIVLANGTSLNLKRGIISANQKGEFTLPHLTFKIPQYQMPSVKNAAGYFSKSGMDILDLFIGQEGTLGVVSEIEIALIPDFRETFDLVAFFPTEDLAVDFVLETKEQENRKTGKQENKTINFFEFFDENTLQMLKKTYTHIPEGVKAAVYIEQEITPENEKNYLENWEKLLEKYRVSFDNCWLGMDSAQKEELKQFRHSVPEHINELFKEYKSVKMATDIAVPDDKFKEMFNFYNSQLTPTTRLTTHNTPLQLFFIKFGHIGENHLHVNLLPKTEEEKNKAQEIIMSFVKKAISLGGTISAEHGVGKIKHSYLREMYGEQGITEMIRIKKAFDPNCILGLGNIFPKELLGR